MYLRLNCYFIAESEMLSVDMDTERRFVLDGSPAAAHDLDSVYVCMLSDTGDRKTEEREDAGQSVHDAQVELVIVRSGLRAESITASLERKIHDRSKISILTGDQTASVYDNTERLAFHCQKLLQGDGCVDQFPGMDFIQQWL